MNELVKVGVVGCGKIFGAYAGGCGGFNTIKVTACADMNRPTAEAKAKEFNVPRVCSVEELVNDPEIKIVVNLTIPKAHAEINLAAIRAGKHAYTEKPFALNPSESQQVLAAAKQAGVRVGSAPDTFLGGGIQTCRKLIDDGAIGKPVAATAFMVGRGHESWHPSPEFYYKPGGGPMLDMGPYYLTALVNLLGPVRRVTGSTAITFPERTITSEPLKGAIIKVEVPTHYAGVMDFANGAIGTIIMSFDVRGGHSLPRLEVYGTEGTLSVPDPNTFRGPVKLRRAGETEWTEIPLTHSDKVGRGIGVADMACAMQSGRAHRASGELAHHVLEVMCAFEEASALGRHVNIVSKCERPAALPVGLKEGELDL
jgi:predicted dehydrogenase